MENRVLLVDDDQTVLKAVGDYLRASLACDVHCASDRDEAGALIGSYQYALAVTDLALSGYSLDGLDLVDDLANVPNGPKILVMTGHGGQDVVAMAIAKGADAVFHKGQPAARLARIARELLAAPRQSSHASAPRSRLMNDLLSGGRITAVAQPVVDLTQDTLRIHGIELLSRGPAGTPFFRPDTLFSYARRKHEEHILDKHCAEKALEASRELPSGTRISINLHSSTLCRDEGVPWLLHHASANGIDTSRLTIEIIEHAPTWDEPNLLRSLGVLRTRGISIAIDDVGTGEANYQMILAVRPDCLKIDRHFINDCHKDENRRRIISSVQALAAQFGARVIAEGVEQLADIKVLAGMGVHLMQGYAFCPPVDVKICVDRIRKLQSAGVVAGTCSGGELSPGVC